MDVNSSFGMDTYHSIYESTLTMAIVAFISKVRKRWLTFKYASTSKIPHTSSLFWWCTCVYMYFDDYNCIARKHIKAHINCIFASTRMASWGAYMYSTKSYNLIVIIFIGPVRFIFIMLNFWRRIHFLMMKRPTKRPVNTMIL